MSYARLGDLLACGGDVTSALGLEPRRAGAGGLHAGADDERGEGRDRRAEYDLDPEAD
jgi:hypothetical protein